MAITAHYIYVDQVKVFYETNNSMAKDVLICMHSEGRETRQFHRLMETLADGFRVLAFDMPAHGKTWPMPGNIPIRDIKEYLSFAKKVIAAFGLEKPWLLGCGLGANCALALGTDEQLGGIIAISGVANTVSDVPLELLRHPQISLPFAVQEYNKSITGKAADEESRELICWQAWCETAITYQADIGMLCRFDIRDKLEKITCPILLVKGMDDWTIDDEMLRETLDGLTHSELVRSVSLQDAGRYAMIEQPKELAAHILSFRKMHNAAPA